ncbi:GNAT family N-acetyltransferase [Streptomyces sp. SAJ15]|uniref:GNAT family N-acetyltransferase n=1 Tax=Streptomyces sp. SAJ15 TaxID=2011095 RepID=UPI001184B11F|nr:GNAT family N-acetyltransferase [Streptomyces sp. SAJ15]TVL89161.1 GNAT family N-acetyltransferase [Streptomyces sp. SAJ15]
MADHTDTSRVRIEPWAEGDLDLLRALNAPAAMVHLGGPESEEKLVERHARYLALPGTGTGRMYRVTLRPEGTAVGCLGFWERSWRGETVYETGWSVLPGHQGRGIAAAAAAAVISAARAERRHRHLHAFPSVGNAASNAVCLKAGFTLLGGCELEYPPGHIMRCHDWRIDISS